LAYNSFILSNQDENSIIYNDLILSKELGFDLFTLSKEDFEKNPFLEKELKKIFKQINNDNDNKSIYDLKYYYLFFYNLYKEKKIILPICYLNDIDKDNEEINQVKKIKNLVYFDSLYNKYNIEIFNGNNINLIYNTYIFNIKNNKISIDDLVEKKVKNQIIFHNIMKKYLKCNKITFLIITELL
jgi:hypothetical protein